MAIQSHNDGFNGNAECRLRVDHRSDAALRPWLQHLREPEPGHRPMGSRGARLHAREPQRPVHGAADRPARPPRLPAHPHALFVDATARASRRSRCRPCGSSMRSRVGGAQVAGGQHSKTLTLGSDFDYVRGNHTWRIGTQIDTARLALGRSHQLPRHLHVREPRRLRRRPAAQLHPAHRRSEHRLHLLPGRALRAGRLSHPAQPDAERRRALRSAEPRRRFRQRHAAPRRHLGARHRRHDDAARELGHLHRLAAERHLRADAACRRRTAEGDRSRQSAVSNHLRPRVA